MAVVVLGVLGQHGCGMPLVDDQEVGEELAPNAADEAFGDPVRPRCPDGRLDVRTSMAVNTARTRR
jgi:hypothetical protein